MKKSFLSCLALFFLLTACGENSNVFLAPVDGSGLRGAPVSDQTPSPEPSPSPEPTPSPDKPTPSIPPAPSAWPFMGRIDEQFTQKKQISTNKVDILFSVDASGSMITHIEKVAANIATFTEYLVSKKVDFQIGMVISSDTQQGNQPHLRGPHPIIRSAHADPAALMRENLAYVLSQASGSYELGLTVLEQAIDYPLNRALFRSDAGKAFIVLTDARDNEKGDIDNLAHFMQVFNNFSKDLPWVLVGIGAPADGSGTCPLEEDANELLSALALSSGGLMGNICDESYQDIMKLASERIRNMLLTEFSLAKYPELAWVKITKMQVFVNGTEIPQDPERGWVWDPKFLAVAFRGSYVPPEGSSIRILVEYTSE